MGRRISFTKKSKTKGSEGARKEDKKLKKKENGEKLRMGLNLSYGRSGNH